MYIYIYVCVCECVCVWEGVFLYIYNLYAYVNGYGSFFQNLIFLFSRKKKQAQWIYNHKLYIFMHDCIY